MDDWFERERLHRAAEAGDVPAVQDLVGRGYPLNAFDELGKTPLHYAVLGEHFAVIDYLLRNGADLNAHDERMIGDTPLGEAASTCSLKMARLLVESGADPTVRGWMQLNAVDRAKQRRHSEGTGSEGQAVYEFLREASRTRKARR
jgi:ankyrin repeat protein